MRSQELSLLRNWKYEPPAKPMNPSNEMCVSYPQQLLSFLEVMKCREVVKEQLSQISVINFGQDPMK